MYLTVWGIVGRDCSTRPRHLAMTGSGSKFFVYMPNVTIVELITGLGIKVFDVDQSLFF